MTRILLVDDQPSFRNHFCRMLIQAGQDVVGEANSLHETELRFWSLQPELVVLDMILPDVSGMEGIQRLKEMQPEVRVIMISAYLDQSKIYESAALDAGAEAFFSKDDLDFEVVRNW